MAAEPTAFDPESFTPQDLERKINEQVFGQGPAAARLAHALWWNKERLDLVKAGVPAESIPGKLNVLFVASTGQGKTFMLKLAARLLKVPFYPTLATNYSSTGYYGQNVDEMVAGLLSAAGFDVAKAQRGIIFVDEIDKLGRKKGADGRLDVSGVGVQQALLGVAEGTTVAVDRGPFKHYVDTSGVTFVSAGAFDGLAVPPDEMRQIPGDALVRFGMMPELLGRFPVRAGLNALGEAGMRRLLVEAESSELKKLQRVFHRKNVELTFTEGWIDAVVRDASKYPTGVRALNEIIQDRCMEVHARLPELAKRPGTKVTVDVKGVRESAGGRLPTPSAAPERPAGQTAPPKAEPAGSAPAKISGPAKPVPPADTPARPGTPRVRRVEAPPEPPGQQPPKALAPGRVPTGERQLSFDLDDALGAKESIPKPPPEKPRRLEPPKPPSVVEAPPPPGPWRAAVEWVSAHPVKVVAAIALAVLLAVAAGRATKNDNAPSPSRPSSSGETKHRLFPELDSSFGQ